LVKKAELPAAPAAKTNGNIGKQQVEASTTLPSAARLARIVRPDPPALALALSIAVSFLSAASYSRRFTFANRNHWTPRIIPVFAEFPRTRS